MFPMRHALRKMPNRKCADQVGLVMEVFKHGSEGLLQALLGLFNSMLHSGEFDPAWKETLFIMLPKAGDLSMAGNWRPIAILQITYKIFSR